MQDTGSPLKQQTGVRKLPANPSALVPHIAVEDAIDERLVREHRAAALPAAKDRTVLIVNPAGVAEHGGMGRMVRYLLDSWSRIPDAPKVRVLDPRGSGSALLSPFFLSVTILQILWERLFGHVRLLHVNMAENTSVVRKGTVVILGRLLKIPTLLHLHAGLFIDFYESLPGIAKFGCRQVFRQADHVAVLGEVWRRYLVERLGIPAEKVSVLYNGVAPAPPRRPAADPTLIRLVFVGKLRAEKGLVELFEVLARPEFADRNWRLTLVGEGDFDRFETLAEALGIADRLRFTGWLEQQAVHQELAEADIFVLPSHYEGMPLGVLEALSAGVPVVTTSVGALPEVLQNGESAMLVPPKTRDPLAKALDQLMSDPALRARLSAAGPALFARHFSIDSYARGIVSLYERVAPTHR